MMARKQKKSDPNKLHPVKEKRLREEARDKAQQLSQQSIKDLPRVATLSGKPIKADEIIPDYSITVDGLRLSNWKDLKRIPLSSDTFERFDNPKTLCYAFGDYVKSIRNNPAIKKEILKSGARAGEVLEIETDRPLLLDSFLSFISMPMSYWEKKKKDENFAELCEGIERMIRANHIEGAMLGIFDSPMVKAVDKIGDTVTITHEKALKVDISINGEKLPNTIELE